jgi:hypothetical protein
MTYRNKVDGSFMVVVLQKGTSCRTNPRCADARHFDF